MVVAGLVGVTVGMGIAAWRAMRWTVRGREVLGLFVVGVAAISAFACALTLGGPLVALTAPTAATLVGVALGLRGGGDDLTDDADPEPPWWPSFEHDLEEYGRRHRPATRV